MTRCTACSSKNKENVFCRSCGNFLAAPVFRQDTAILFSSFILAILSFVFFYGVFPLPYISHSQNYIYRIFTNHIICRVIAFLFFWGIWFSIQKIAALHKQKNLIWQIRQMDFLNTLKSNVHDISKFLESFTITAYSKRNIRVNRSYLIYFIYELTSGNAINIENKINDLFNFLYDRLESSFAIIRVFIWILPILGFMGTILGITSSIDGFTHSLGFKDVTVNANVAGEASGINQVFASLTKVTDGLRTAFDTTFIGLFLVIPLMVLYTYLKNKESEVYAEMENYLKKSIVPELFPHIDTHSRQAELDALYSTFHKINTSNNDLAEHLQILCLRIDRMTSQLKQLDIPNPTNPKSEKPISENEEE